jgi:hypothetical protein
MAAQLKTKARCSRPCGLAGAPDIACLSICVPQAQAKLWECSTGWADKLGVINGEMRGLVVRRYRQGHGQTPAGRQNRKALLREVPCRQ